MLGRGLEALIPKRPSASDQNTQQHDVVPPQKEAVFLIESEKIKSNPYQPRREFDKKTLQELADSIKRYGILQPLIVTKIIKEVPRGEKVEYQLVAGERRLRAAKMVGFRQVPAIIREAPARSKLELSLIENVQREDLNGIEKALAFKQLIDEFHLKHQEIADRIGKSRELVTNTLRLLKLPPRVQQAIAEGRISENHGRAILILGNPKQQLLFFDTIIREGLAPKDAEKRARDAQLTQAGKPSSSTPFRHKLARKTRLSEISREAKELEEKIRAIMRIQAVSVHFHKDRPKITIHFNSKKELFELLERIKPTLT